MASSYDHLVHTIHSYNPHADLTLIKKAFDLATASHKGQRRLSGEPYVNHAIRTAQFLAEMKLQTPLVIAGLLHDVPEDTTTTLDEIKKTFGEDVSSIIEGITKIGKVKYRGVSRYVENVRKFFIAMAEDARSLIVKFADRIDNLRTLDSHPPKKQFRIALESLEIFAPAANRLGMGEIKCLIEDLSFKYVNPKEYEWVKALVEQRYTKKQEFINRVMEITKKELGRNGVKIISMEGRLKSLYSLYKKLLKHERDITKIYDLIAVRILVHDVAECYSALGVLHQLWKPLKGRIKDYISQPKPNGYQSLHTTVFAIGGEIVEFQIRTEQMHDAAEYGLAAHWHYDETNKKSKIPEHHKKWIEELALIHKEMVKGMQDIEKLKMDVFQNRIFVLTPKGDVIDLPEDATPVDFAYAIHSDIGNKCSGCRVNGEMTRLDTPLKSGDMIEIIIDKNRKGPSPDWLKFVKTAGASEKIRNFARKSLTDWIKNVLPSSKK